MSERIENIANIFQTLTYDEMIEVAAQMLAMPGPKQWWLESKSWFSPVFVASLDEHVDSPAAQQSAAADST